MSENSITEIEKAQAPAVLPEIESEAGEQQISARPELLHEDASGIPDGGLTAWLQCASSFSIFFNGWGLVNTYGVFQTFYEETLLPNQSSSNISWIGSIQAGLLMSLGLATGPLLDYGYLRTLLLVGTFFITFGMMMTSLCKEYWQIVLSQGILVGFGFGCLFVPSVAILPTYFSTRKSLALGIGVSGSSLGGVIYPIIFHKLQPKIGFPWTTRVIGFIVFTTLCIPLIFLKARLKPSSRRRILELAAWREAPYFLFGISAFFIYTGLYIPSFYIQTYAIGKGIVDRNLGFYLLAILNTGSFLGRLFPHYVAHKVGPLNACIFCALVSAVLGFCWISIESTASVIVFCVIYGAFSGLLVSLLLSVVVTLSPHPGVIGVRLGMIFVPIACGLLIGNPIAGAILRTRGGDNWVGLAAFCGSTVLLSVVSLGVTRVLKVGWKLGAKA